jgi:hypothetical protein
MKAQTGRKKTNGHSTRRLKNKKYIYRQKYGGNIVRKARKKIRKRQKNLYTEGLLQYLFIAGR